MKSAGMLEILNDSEESEGMPDATLNALIRPTARTICPGRMRRLCHTASVRRLMQLQTRTDNAVNTPTSIINPVLK